MNDKEIREAVAKTLKELRKANHLSQEDIVKKIGEDKISLRTYKTFESGKGKYVPSLEKISLFAEFYHKPIDYFISGRTFTYDDDFSWEATIKRFDRLFFGLVLVPCDENNNIFFIHDDELKLYLDQLTAKSSNSNYKFDKKFETMPISVQFFDDAINDTIKNAKSNTYLTKDRLIKVEEFVGNKGIREQIQKSVKEFAKKYRQNN